MPPYQPYPAVVGTGIRYGDYYWNCPAEMDNVPHKEAADADVPVPEPEEKTLHNPGRNRESETLSNLGEDRPKLV
ncbi:hypothetical protein KIL84_008160 [Mauremys mutica]|uniref:Uncharacterized protein n=1 Tax=Mauremys mutica TaxID=74926 RepID=A0A9D4ALH1_9SAUR|nr:hypothetical protein KIL84_008160 [Mauremys mutica]